MEMFEKNKSFKNKIIGAIFAKKYKIIEEDRFLTTDKGLDVQFKTITSFSSDRSMGLEVITYILDKYHENPSVDSQGALILGEFFKKYQGDDSHLSHFHASKVPLTRGRGEYSLDVIEVEEKFKGKGIGTLSYELSEYLFAKFLMDRKIKEGFVDGVFAPLDDSKYFETQNFYYKNGFDILPAQDEIHTRRTILYKPIMAEQLLEDKIYRKFEKVEQTREYIE